MTEVDYDGGGHRTRLKDQLIILCVHGVPPVYKGVEGRLAGPRGTPKERRNPPPNRSRIHPFLVLLARGKGEGKREREREIGVAPPSPSPIRTSPWGRGAATLEAFLSFPVWPIKAQYEFP